MFSGFEKEKYWKHRREKKTFFNSFPKITRGTEFILRNKNGIVKKIKKQMQLTETIIFWVHMKCTRKKV